MNKNIFQGSLVLMKMSSVPSRASVISGGCPMISEGEKPRDRKVDLERGGDTNLLTNYGRDE